MTIRHIHLSARGVCKFKRHIPFMAILIKSHTRCGAVVAADGECWFFLPEKQGAGEQPPQVRTGGVSVQMSSAWMRARPVQPYHWLRAGIIMGFVWCGNGGLQTGERGWCMYKWNGVVTAGIICGFPSPQGGGTVRLLIDEFDRNSCFNFFRISLLCRRFARQFYPVVAQWSPSFCRL